MSPNYELYATESKRSIICSSQSVIHSHNGNRYCNCNCKCKSPRFSISKDIFRIHNGKSYLKAGFEAGAKAVAEAKMVAKQKAVFILIYFIDLDRIVRYRLLMRFLSHKTKKSWYG